MSTAGPRSIAFSISVSCFTRNFEKYLESIFVAGVAINLGFNVSASTPIELLVIPATTSSMFDSKLVKNGSSNLLHEPDRKELPTSTPVIALYCAFHLALIALSGYTHSTPVDSL